MVDPTTVMIGAAVGGLTSAAMGKNPFTGALLGGAGAGFLGSMGGAAGTGGATASGTGGAVGTGAVTNATYGNPELISPFTQSGVAGGVTNSMGGLPPLMDPQTAGMYSGKAGMFDSNMIPVDDMLSVTGRMGVDQPILEGAVSTGGGASNNILNKIGIGEYNIGNAIDAIQDNPKAGLVGMSFGSAAPNNTQVAMNDTPPLVNTVNTADRVNALTKDFGGFDNATKGQMSDSLLANIQRKQMPYSLYNQSLLG